MVEGYSLGVIEVTKTPGLAQRRRSDSRSMNWYSGPVRLNHPLDLQGGHMSL